MKLKTLLFAAVAAVGLASTARADTIASKLELQGTPDHIQVTGLMARVRNGMLQIQAELTNTSNAQRRLFYRVKWLDDAGFQVWSDEAWKPVLLHGQQKQNLMAVAPTPQAQDFRIQINAEDNEGESGTTTIDPANPTSQQ